VLLSKRDHIERGRETGVLPKKLFILPLLARLAWIRLQISTNMLLIITSTSDEIFTGIYLDYLKRPWTSKRGFIDFFAISDCDTHIKNELRRSGWR